MRKLFQWFQWPAKELAVGLHLHAGLGQEALHHLGDAAPSLVQRTQKEQRWVLNVATGEMPRWPGELIHGSAVRQVVATNINYILFMGNKV